MVPVSIWHSLGISFTILVNSSEKIKPESVDIPYFSKLYDNVKQNKAILLVG